MCRYASSPLAGATDAFIVAAGLWFFDTYCFGITALMGMVV